jgi:hypothetical protein
MKEGSCLLGPVEDYHIWSNFWKFYLIETGFTLGEPVSLVEMFRLFKLEQIFFGVGSVNAVGRCTTSYYLLVWTWCIMHPSSFVCPVEIFQTMVPLVTLLVSLETSRWVQVHWVGFHNASTFIVEKLLNIK